MSEIVSRDDHTLPRTSGEAGACASRITSPQLSAMDGDTWPGRDAVETARRHVEHGPVIPWDLPSRHGKAGALVRRCLRRMLRPYTARQAAFERSLVDALEAVAGGSDASRIATFATPLNGGDVIDALTVIGPLWLHGQDQVVTPCLAGGNVWEPALSEFLRSSLKPKMTFVDVGANVGYFSILAHQVMGPGGRVVAIEPQPGTIDLLRANLWRHGYLDTYVLPVAAYSHFGHLELIVNEENRGGSVMARENVGTTLIACAPLDDLLGGRRVDIIKIDAEGCDHLVVEGASRTIARNPGLVIVVEFWPRLDTIRDRSPADVIDVYRQAGYNLHRIEADGSLTAMSGDEILAQPEDFFELVLVPRRATSK